MKLFVAVIMFASVSIVFADDVVWQLAPPFSLTPGSSSQESGKAPKDRMSDSDEKQAQAQGSQQNAGSKSILKTEPETKHAQAANQQTKGDIDPDKKRWETFWFVFWVFVAGATPIGVGIGFLTYWQNKKAHALTEQHRERADRITQATERAHVSVEEWNGEDIWDDDIPRQITFSLVNRGKVAATIIATASACLENEEGEPPEPFKPVKEELFTNLAGTKLYADRPLKLGIPLYPGTAFRKDVENRRMILYPFVYVFYHDGFGEREFCTFVEFNNRFGWQFVPWGGADYNYDK